MASFNKCILMGNLTRDPALSYLPSQTPVVEFGLAMNRKWTDRQTNQPRESVCFVDCYCYGKQAETINQYMRKGRLLLVEGRLELDTWEKDGQRRSKHRVFVERFTFLGDGQQQQSDSGQYARPPAAAQPNAQPPPNTQPPPNSYSPPQEYPAPSPALPEHDEPAGGDIPF